MARALLSCEETQIAFGRFRQGAVEVANRAHSKVREGATDGGNTARGRSDAI